MIGKTISHYKIIEKIGEGGMGVVYKAHDLKLDRFVALKFLPGQLGRDNELKQRFIHEAKAASALDHPNIGTVYEIDETDPANGEDSFGKIFIALAYYEGQTLQERIDRDGKIPIEESISIITQIASGLEKAHEKGIIHRDIKPANIMITNEGEIKIVDFGVAKLKGQSKITKEDSTLGTIAYMSPEQAKGIDVDSRTDIWSLGVVFYEMVTGKSPFDADFDQAIIYNILNENPEAVTILNKNVPMELDAIIQKCLQKDRKKRFKSVSELQSELIKVIQKYEYTLKISSGEFQPAGINNNKYRFSPVPTAIAAVLLIIVILYAFVYLPDAVYTDYEEAFFKTHFAECSDLSKSERFLENVKANRYYILASVFSNHDTIPDELRREYQNLLIDNPHSPEAYYYQALVGQSIENPTEGDSIWLLHTKAADLGLDNLYSSLDKFIFYRNNRFTQQALEMVNLLMEEYDDNPDVMFEIGSFYQHQVPDTSMARQYFEKTLALYDEFMPAYLRLFEISLNNNHHELARKHIEKAKEINPEDEAVMEQIVRFYETEGRFDEAEKCLKEAISSFAINDLRFYRKLARLYQRQDDFEKCSDLIAEALEKFPDEDYFTYLEQSIERRKEWIELAKEHEQELNLVKWSEDYDLSLEKAILEKKPMVIDFYTTWCGWCKVLEEKTYPDPDVQEALKMYIPVKINAEIKGDLRRKYKVNAFPTLIIVDGQGNKLDEIIGFKEPPEFLEDLNSGLEIYQKYAESATLGDRQITEASNLEDGKLLAESKHMPLMVVFVSKESDWSNKLLDETLKNPLVKSEIKNVVLVKIDQAHDKNVIREWDIRYFPSIIFFDDKGVILLRIHGYQPPEELAILIADVRFDMIQGKKIDDRLNWLYTMEEAKTYASLQNKNILIYADADWCPPCQQVKDYVFTNPMFIETVMDKFILVMLDDVRDAETVKELGISIFPTFIITDANQKEIVRLKGFKDHHELITALDIEERERVYAILGQEKYHEFYKYESLAYQLRIHWFNQSAIEAIKKQIEIYPEYGQSYASLGEVYLQLKKPAEAMSYYKLAIDKGAELDQSFAENMLNACLQLKRDKDFEEWIKDIIDSDGRQNNEKAVLYNICSEFCEILQDRNSAIYMAELAIKVKPDYADGYIKLGRLYYLEDKYDIATDYLKRAIEINKDDPQPCFYLGLIAGKTGDMSAKELCYENAKQRSKWAAHQVGWRQRYITRPGYYLYDGYLDLIEEGYRYTLELDDHIMQKNDLAYFLAIENRNLDEALTLIEEALEEDPENILMLDTKAVILFKQGKYQKANEMVLQYEERIDENMLEWQPAVSYYLGRIKCAVGDTVTAKNYFSYALNPKGPDVRGERIQKELMSYMNEHNLQIY
jgi:serine/threonine protein kinase/thioredoxin-related protein/uncharacterized protein HemY